jgi:hypothetical protein
MQKVSEYMTLPSNASMDIYPNNTIANYRVKLPRKYNFEENVEVALVEFSYTKSWTCNNLVNADVKLVAIGQYSEAVLAIINNNIKRVFLRELKYSSIPELIVIVNNSLEKLSCSDPPRLEFIPDHNKIRIYPGVYEIDDPNDGVRVKVNVGPIFSEDLEQHLCLTTFDHYDNSHLNNNYKYVNGDWYDELHPGLKEVNLEGDIKMLFVYSNITYPSVVGDTTAQLLRTTAVSRKIVHGEQVLVTFDTPHYLPLLKKSFDEIEVDIKDSTGSNPHFQFGRSSIVLHFRSKDD